MYKGGDAMKKIYRYCLYALFVAVVVLTVKEDSQAGSFVVGPENRGRNIENEEVDFIRYPYGCRDRSSLYRKRYIDGYKRGYRDGRRAYPVSYIYRSRRISLRPTYHIPYERFRGYSNCGLRP